MRNPARRAQRGLGGLRRHNPEASVGRRFTPPTLPRKLYSQSPRLSTESAFCGDARLVRPSVMLDSQCVSRLMPPASLIPYPPDIKEQRGGLTVSTPHYCYESYYYFFESCSLRAARASMSPRVVFSTGVETTGSDSLRGARLGADFLDSARSALASSSKIRL